MGKRTCHQHRMTAAFQVVAATAVVLLASACNRATTTDADKSSSSPPPVSSKGSESRGSERAGFRQSTLQEAERSQKPVLSGETIAPYFVELHETEATICWVSSEPSLGSVVVHGPHGTKTYSQIGEASRFHHVALSDLQPGTPYRYEVGNNHRARFETVGSQSAFRVAVFGHTGGTDEPREYPTQLLADHLAALRPDVTLCTGDIAYHSSIAGFRDTFFRPFSRFLEERPIYVAASNHDCGWPWLYGIDYDNVRRLFPHNYGSSKGAYYHFDHKNTRFFAVSYVQSTAEFQQQVKWLTDALDASTAEFNIVYMGGQATTYYDKDYFFKTISSHPVDLVIGGDGGGKFQENHHGVPFFFIGDSVDKHHAFYWLSVKDYRFSVRILDSGGVSRSNLWQFFSTRPKKPVLDLKSHSLQPLTHRRRRSTASSSTSTGHSAKRSQFRSGGAPHPRSNWVGNGPIASNT